MEKQTQDLRNELGKLADDARALLAATTEVAGQKAEDARKRLQLALGQAKETCARVHDNVVHKGKAMDQSVRESPYSAIGIALGLGLLIGCLWSRKQCTRTAEGEQGSSRPA